MNDITKNQIKGRVRIYACGGAGINIANLIPSLQVNPDLMADFEIVQIDTSFSNLTPRASNFENYMLAGVSVDGSGKDQTENLELVREHTKPILKAHPPLDANIVVSTGSGGSGSVIATHLAEEMLRRGEIVFPLLIGTTGSRREANNSIGTRRNYQEIAESTNAPILLSYLQNSREMTRENVNAAMLSTISYLGILFSRVNKGLDKRDLRNFAYFTRPEVTKVNLKPQVYNLTILLREVAGKPIDKLAEADDKFADCLDKLGNILSVAVLAKAPNATEMPEEFTPEYFCDGYLPDLKDSAAFANHSVNFLVSDGLLEAQTASLRKVARRDRPQVEDSSLKDEDDEDTGVSFGKR